MGRSIMMKYCEMKYLLWLFAVSVFCALTGCMEETIVNNINGADGKSGSFLINLYVPGTETVVTRGENESDIKEVNVLLFGPSDTNESNIKFLAYCKAAHVKDNLYLVNNLPFNAKTDNEERNVLIIANADSLLKDVLGAPYSPESTTTREHSLQSIKESLLTKTLSTSAGGFTKDQPDFPIKMTSAIQRFENGLKEGVTIPEDGTAIALTRMLAKITIKSTLSKDIFKLEGATVCDVAQQGYILPVDSARISTIDRISYKGEQDEMAVDTTETGLGTMPMYVYETNVGVSPDPVKVIIKAKYHGESSYYRLDIRLKNDETSKKGISLQRNHEYIIEIKNVDAAGWNSYQLARNNPAENIEFEVSDKDNSDTEVIGGYSFSIDYENVDIYADSLSSVMLARVTTDYPLLEGGDLGNISASGGMTLLSSPKFIVGQNYMDILVGVPSSFSQGAVNIELGNYNKQIKVIKYHSLDIHLDNLQYSNIKSARIQSGSGSTDLRWVGLSVEDYYNPVSNGMFLDESQLAVNNYNLYIYLNENLQRTPREAELSLVDIKGMKRKVYINQEGYDRYKLGYFGGTVVSTDNISMFSKNLIVEAYEEEEGKLIWSNEEINEGKDVLTSDDGKESTWILATKYQSPAALYCLHKNIDKNMNGTIDRDELEWYLPSIKQGLGISLYELMVDNLRSAYWSSTVLRNDWNNVWSFFSSQNYGSDEILDKDGHGGFQISLSSKTAPRYVRCVRDI